MKKVFYIFIILFLFTSFSYATTREVGSGKTYSTVQAGVNAASSGDIVLVYPGTYQEDVDVATSNITIQASETPFSGSNQSIMDGNSGSLGYAFYVSVSDVKIIGFKVQNYNTVTGTDYGYGVIRGERDAINMQVKYCYFTSNTVDVSNGALISIGRWSGDSSGGTATGVIIRGNLFSGNTIGTSNDMSSINMSETPSVIVELNKFSNSGQYSAYLRGAGAAKFRYNWQPGAYSRLRYHVNFTVEHNIFQNSALQLHDQCPEDYSSEGHTVQRNTFYGSMGGRSGFIELSRQDDDDIISNLFVGIGTTVGISDYYENTCTTTGITLTNNQHYNVTTWLLNLDGTEYSESGTTTSDPSYGSLNGTCSSTTCNPGADLDITAWPLTTHSGTATTWDTNADGIPDDWPYGGADTSPPNISGAGPSGLQDTYENPREIHWNAGDSTPPVTCKWDTSDVAYDSMANTADTSGCEPGYGFCADITTVADTAYHRYVRCADSVGTPNKNSSSEDISWTEGSSGDSDPPTTGQLALVSPTNAYCTVSPESFVIYVPTVADSDSGVSNCGILFTSNEGSFVYTDSGTWVQMTQIGSDWYYYPSLICNDIERQYSVACWDIAGNVTSFNSTRRVTFTPTLELITNTVTLGTGGNTLTFGGSNTGVPQ